MAVSFSHSHGDHYGSIRGIVGDTTVKFGNVHISGIIERGYGPRTIAVVLLRNLDVAEDGWSAFGMTSAVRNRVSNGGDGSSSAPRGPVQEEHSVVFSVGPHAAITRNTYEL